ncbi:MAG TPA: PH domain-containing protein [Anaerolineaceae bacterium]
MSDKYLQSLLGEKEQVLFVTRQHWLTLLGEILIELILSVVLVVLVSLIWVLWLPNFLVALGYLLLIFPLISLWRDVLIWSKRKYVVTNYRVIQLSGVFNKNITDSSLEKVNDVKMSQSFLGRMFGYGDIEILTASELGVNKFTHISQPIQYKTAMINAKEKLERPPAPAAPARPAPNVADLLAQLDELRQKGVLTDAEFQSKKAELLTKM